MPTRSPGSALRVALLGLGTVGREVARSLLDRERRTATATERPLELVALGVPDPKRSRAIEIPPDVRVSGDLESVAGDEAADVVVELMGGLEPAGELVADALRRGRAVVTANKALLARRGAELERISRNGGGALRFEAAVGGGIPLLSPLASDLAANRWTSVRGIMNGTTNHVLTEMSGGRNFDEAVADAQRRGYAEADASGDLEGRDAADKIAILTRLAFNAWPDVEQVARRPPRTSGEGGPGITNVTREEVAEADRLGLTLKLVARGELVDGNLHASVVPSAVPSGSVLGRASGVTNVVELVGWPVGLVYFGGPGAGGAATSSAVLGDLLAIWRGEGSTWAALPEARRAESVERSLPQACAWFFVGPGGGSLTEPLTLEQARAALVQRRTETTLYPVLEEAA